MGLKRVLHQGYDDRLTAFNGSQGALRASDEPAAGRTTARDSLTSLLTTPRRVSEEGPSVSYSGSVPSGKGTWDALQGTPVGYNDLNSYDGSHGDPRASHEPVTGRTIAGDSRASLLYNHLRD